MDNTATGTQDGTLEHPYQSLTAALVAPPAGAIIALRANTYTEPQLIPNNVRIVTWAGTSVIR